MGWRTDAAYEKALRKDFDARRSLTWGEWVRWQVDRHWAFGAAIAVAVS